MSAISRQRGPSSTCAIRGRFSGNPFCQLPATGSGSGNAAHPSRRRRRKPVQPKQAAAINMEEDEAIPPPVEPEDCTSGPCSPSPPLPPPKQHPKKSADKGLDLLCDFQLGEKMGHSDDDDRSCTLVSQNLEDEVCSGPRPSSASPPANDAAPSAMATEEAGVQTPVVSNAGPVVNCEEELGEEEYDALAGLFECRGEEPPAAKVKMVTNNGGSKEKKYILKKKRSREREEESESSDDEADEEDMVGPRPLRDPAYRRPVFRVRRNSDPVNEEELRHLFEGCLGVHEAPQEEGSKIGSDKGKAVCMEDATQKVDKPSVEEQVPEMSEVACAGGDRSDPAADVASEDPAEKNIEVVVEEVEEAAGVEAVEEDEVVAEKEVQVEESSIANEAPTQEVENKNKPCRGIKRCRHTDDHIEFSDEESEGIVGPTTRCRKEETEPASSELTFAPRTPVVIAAAPENTDAEVEQVVFGAEAAVVAKVDKAEEEKVEVEAGKVEEEKAEEVEDYYYYYDSDHDEYKEQWSCREDEAEITKEIEAFESENLLRDSFHVGKCYWDTLDEDISMKYEYPRSPCVPFAATTTTAAATTAPLAFVAPIAWSGSFSGSAFETPLKSAFIPLNADFGDVEMVMAIDIMWQHPQAACMEEATAMDIDLSRSKEEKAVVMALFGCEEEDMEFEYTPMEEDIPQSWSYSRSPSVSTPPLMARAAAFEADQMPAFLAAYVAQATTSTSGSTPTAESALEAHHIGFEEPYSHHHHHQQQQEQQEKEAAASLSSSPVTTLLFRQEITSSLEEGELLQDDVTIGTLIADVSNGLGSFISLPSCDGSSSDDDDSVGCQEAPTVPHLCAASARVPNFPPLPDDEPIYGDPLLSDSLALEVDVCSPAKLNAKLNASADEEEDASDSIPAVPAAGIAIAVADGRAASEATASSTENCELTDEVSISAVRISTESGAACTSSASGAEVDNEGAEEAEAQDSEDAYSLEEGELPVWNHDLSDLLRNIAMVEEQVAVVNDEVAVVAQEEEEGVSSDEAFSDSYKTDSASFDVESSSETSTSYSTADAAEAERRSLLIPSFTSRPAGRGFLGLWWNNHDDYQQGLGILLDERVALSAEIEYQPFLKVNITAAATASTESKVQQSKIEKGGFFSSFRRAIRCVTSFFF